MVEGDRSAERLAADFLRFFASVMQERGDEAGRRAPSLQLVRPLPAPLRWTRWTGSMPSTSRSWQPCARRSLATSARNSSAHASNSLLMALLEDIELVTCLAEHVGDGPTRVHALAECSGAPNQAFELSH